MSQQHKEALLRASLIQRDESIDDAISYRVQVLQALGSDHDLFERGCVDLLTILIDTKMMAKTLAAVEYQYASEGDATSVEKVMKMFASAAATVFARSGLGHLSTIPRINLNPNAASYESPSTAVVTGARVNSSICPPLSSSTTTPQKQESSIADTPSPMPNMAKTMLRGGEAGVKTSGWGKKTIRVRNLPATMTANKLMIEADKFMGDVEEFNADTLEALVSFPAVTAGDMLMGGVVIGDQLCPCDQKVAPLRPSSSGLSFETKKTNEAKHMPVANNLPANKAIMVDDLKPKPVHVKAVNKIDDGWGTPTEPKKPSNDGWDEPTPVTTSSKKIDDGWGTPAEPTKEEKPSNNEWDDPLPAAKASKKDADHGWGAPSKPTAEKKPSTDEWEDPAPAVETKAKAPLTNGWTETSASKKDDASEWGQAPKATKSHKDFETNANKGEFGVADNKFDEPNKDESTPARASISASDEPMSAFDQMNFTQWRKSRVADSFKNKYRREPSVAVEDENQPGDASHPAEVIGSWGTDGTVSPTVLKQRGLMSGVAELDDANVFALTQTFPWNDHSVAEAFVDKFGKDAVALYHMPIPHDKGWVYKHEQTVTYYAKFRDHSYPSREDYRFCIVPTGGDGGEGWYAKMKPVERVASGAMPVFEEGLVGWRDDDDEDVSLLYQGLARGRGSVKLGG